MGQNEQRKDNIKQRQKQHKTKIMEEKEIMLQTQYKDNIKQRESRIG